MARINQFARENVMLYHSSKNPVLIFRFQLRLMGLSSIPVRSWAMSAIGIQNVFFLSNPLMHRICSDYLFLWIPLSQEISHSDLAMGVHNCNYSNEPRLCFPNEPPWTHPWTLIEAARAAATMHIRRTYYVTMLSPECLLFMWRILVRLEEGMCCLPHLASSHMYDLIFSEKYVCDSFIKHAVSIQLTLWGSQAPVCE